jgi:hypothetical protein
MEIAMNYSLLALIAVLNLPPLVLVARVLFGGWRGFCEALEALFVIDFSNALAGDHHDLKPGKFNMALFVLFAIISTLVEYQLIAIYFLTE